MDIRPWVNRKRLKMFEWKIRSVLKVMTQEEIDEALFVLEDLHAIVKEYQHE